MTRAHRDVWFLIRTQHGNAAVGLWRQDVHKGVGVLLKTKSHQAVDTESPSCYRIPPGSHPTPHGPVSPHTAHPYQPPHQSAPKNSWPTHLVQSNRRVGLEQLAVQRAQDAHVIVGARGRTNDARVLVNGFQELANDQRNGLNPLDFFLEGKGARSTRQGGSVVLASPHTSHEAQILPIPSFSARCHD